MLSLRFAARSLALSRAARYYRPTQIHAFRTFSTTPRRLAAEVPDDFINAIKHTALFQKLADKPNALKALSDLYSLTKEMGAIFSLFPRDVCVGLTPRLNFWKRPGHQFHNSTFPVSNVQTRHKSEIYEGGQARDGGAQCGGVEAEF
jgi:hypothetical protein